MFLAACEGFLDKWSEQSGLIRLQTLFMVQAVGGKLKGGGTIKETDLWSLRNESKKQGKKIFVWPENVKDFKQRMEEAHGIKVA